jgi:hypothetical protein
MTNRARARLLEAGVLEDQQARQKWMDGAIKQLRAYREEVALLCSQRRQDAKQHRIALRTAVIDERARVVKIVATEPGRAECLRKIRSGE